MNTPRFQFGLNTLLRLVTLWCIVLGLIRYLSLLASATLFVLGLLAVFVTVQCVVTWQMTAHLRAVEEASSVPRETSVKHDADWAFRVIPPFSKDALFHVEHANTASDASSVSRST